MVSMYPTHPRVVVVMPVLVLVVAMLAVVMAVAMLAGVMAVRISPAAR